jgi:uncharacterized membrane protein required for colicin V production
MILVNIIAGLVMLLSLIGGIKDGAVKAGFSLLATVIAVPIAGSLHAALAKLLSFLPGDNWENFVGFYIVFVLATIILSLLFLVPRKIIGKLWPKGFFFRLAGAVFNLASSAIGLTVFALVLATFPIWDWLVQAVTGSGVIIWLVTHLAFIQGLLPAVFRVSQTFVAVIS